MKKLLLTIVLFLPFIGYSQLDDEEAQFFGTTRSLYFKQYDFKTVTGEIEHEFFIENTETVPMHMLGFRVDEGVGVVIIDKTIPPKQKGKFIVIINPKYFKEKGDFKKQITAIVEVKQPTGTIERREIPFLIKGSL